ncbi:arylesterase [Bacterioplanoides sp.]|uniref:arylesterase n=1 Tax=Bacterioplanoides sp. TaxID=2066072 RepID=UPI003AFFF79A
MVILLRNLLLIVWISALSVAALSEESKAQDTRLKTILVIGDSISAGFGIPMQQGWVALLGKELQRQGHPTRVINASISGDTSQGGVSRLPALLTTHQPDLVVIELGGNDGLRGTPIRLIRANLQRMMDQATQANSDILLLGMQIPPNYGRKYTQSFREIFPTLASQNAVPYVPFLLDKVATTPGMMQADGIHPTAAAQPLMMASVYPEILAWLKR